MRALFAALAVLSVAAAPALGNGVLNRGNGSEMASLDPHFISTIEETNVEGDLLVGLLTLDAGAHAIPGAATHWETSRDGRTWTFHLRDHLWSDGQPVTARDFVFAWQRLLDPRTGASNAYSLWVIRNAHAISMGSLPPSSLDVEAPDDRTLVVTLEHPAAYLPELLTQVSADPVPRHIVLAKDAAWSKPENFVGNGPFVPTEWILNDHLTLTRNPRFYDAAHVQLSGEMIYPTADSGAALRRLRAGALDTQTPIPLTEMAWLRTNKPGVVHIAPALGLSYVSINLRRPPLNDVRVRRALNLALDREILVEKVLKLGERGAYSIVPPGMPSYPSGPQMPIRKLTAAERLAKAQWLMNQAGYGPARHLSLVYETFEEPNNRRIAAVLQAMMRPIWVDVDVRAMDASAHASNLKQGDYDLGAASWFADFDDASNFLDLLRPSSGNNYGGYHNPRFAMLLDAAQEQLDAGRRADLLRQAEATALGDYPWIPTRFRVSQNLVEPYVKGWVDNPRDIHLARWLWLAQHQ
ncbi:MAG TPA: peptide ABC transporter substrate-binding protein [Rhizomicrobium sp.]|nr:peptide ABC transporter substrate-binding protein [Rhizomicrobium sp.]